MPNSYPRETVEFQPVTVAINGLSVLVGIQFALTSGTARPTTWANPATVSGKIGVMITGLAPGIWTVWAKVVYSPETPVINCGSIVIT